MRLSVEVKWPIPVLAMFIVAFAVWTDLVLAAPQPKQAADQAPAASVEAVASVDEERITQEAFVREMIRRGGHGSTAFSSTAARTALLEEMIQFEVIAAKARQAGYDKDPEVVQATKKVMVQKYWRETLPSQMKDVEATEAEIKEYYARHRERYTGPDMARAAIIYLKYPPRASSEEIEAFRKKAEAILEEAKAQATAKKSFGNLARQYSADRASKGRGGDIGWVAKGASIYKWDKGLIDAIFGLQTPGKIGPVVTTPRGLYLVKLFDTKAGELKPLAEVRREIKRYLNAHKRKAIQDKYYQKIKKDFTIRTNKDLLESLGATSKAAATRGRPPSFPLDTGS